jgi:hypothetical protein
MGQNDIILADLADEILDDIGNATSIRSVFISEDVPAEDDPKTWYVKLIHYFNHFLQSEDFETSWIATGPTFNTSTGIQSPVPDDVTSPDYMGLICANGTGTNSIRQAGSGLGITGKATQGIWCRKSVLDHIILYKTATDSYTVRFDLTNKTSTVTGGSTDNIKIIDLSNDDCLVCIEKTLTAQDGNFHFAASDGVDLDATGDGIADSLLIMGAFLREGTIESNLPYLKTEATAVSAPAIIFEEKAGATGTFTSVTVENGVVVSGT